MKTFYLDENNVVLDETVLNENHVKIEKVTALSSKFSLQLSRYQHEVPSIFNTNIYLSVFYD